MGRLIRTISFHVSLTLLVCSEVTAGSIDVERWRGHDVLRLSGLIEPGLADQLKEKAELAETWPHGIPVLLLDSDGGSVAEAMKVSEFLDETPFHTVVPNYARCASACGSIIFVAGKFRTVEALGLIGQHSCSVGGVPDADCNEQMAAHAAKHGVSRGAITSFVTYTPPEDILWFSREDVDGWGLSRYPGEQESGFEKSEPRVLRMLTGAMPPAQASWRLDFMNDGYRAFLRPASDAEREMQLNLFCYEALPGRLFLSMEINGLAAALQEALIKVLVQTDAWGWEAKPWIIQDDPSVSSIVAEIPPDAIKDILASMDRLEFRIELRQSFQPIVATTYLAKSRKNLVFAANNCAHGDYDLYGQPR